MIEQRIPTEKGFRGLYVLGPLRQLQSFGFRSGMLRLRMSALRGRIADDGVESRVDKGVRIRICLFFIPVVRAA